MTILTEERLTVSSKTMIHFSEIKAEILDAKKKEEHHSHVDQEKKRFAKSGVSYSEFKDLVSAVGLRPVARSHRSTGQGHPIDQADDDMKLLLTSESGHFHNSNVYVLH